MKYVAVDYGMKRVGIAVSDPEEKFAFPLRTLHRETRAAFFEELLRLLREEKAEAVVIGLPYNMDGSECLMTRQVRNFTASLKRRIDLPVYWMDEELSSISAEEELKAMGIGGRGKKELLDQQAAVLILESFLAETVEKRRLA